MASLSSIHIAEFPADASSERVRPLGRREPGGPAVDADERHLLPCHGRGIREDQEASATLSNPEPGERARVTCTGYEPGSTARRERLDPAGQRAVRDRPAGRQHEQVRDEILGEDEISPAPGCAAHRAGASRVVARTPGSGRPRQGLQVADVVALRGTVAVIARS